MQKLIGIVGGGIIGLATGFKLQDKYPSSKVIIFEKESALGQHQSGRNSGVLHCGLYYEPGSLKARLAVDGIQQMTRFCDKYDIHHEICKIVVASNVREVPFLDKLAERGQANGLKGLQFLSSAELKHREPFVRATKSLLVPEEGIVDYPAVMRKLAELIQNSGGEILLNTKLIEAKDHGEKTLVSDDKNEWILDLLVNCSGLYTDRVFKQFTKESKSPVKIVPFRGEYYKLKPDAEKLVNHLVYPVPDPEYPFLGVHFTRMISGIKEVGPNAVFAFKREGYTNSDFSLSDTVDSLTYRGFLNFVRCNFGFALSEFNSSLFKSSFVRKANKLIPDLRLTDIEKGLAGVRAQAMNPAGKLIMDFRIVRKGKQVHVLNAPSPGATASLAIADHIIENYITTI